jgi:hypothetical protein
MKYITTHPSLPFTRKLALFLTLAVLSLTGLVANAHPYASGITGTNGAGVVSFIMNEAGANVDVVFDDGTTNHMGVLPKGGTNFNIGTHTSFRIICFKTGSGVPSLISSDTYSNSVWNVPTTSGTFGMGGVGVNKNASVGTNFGRIYVAQRNAFTTSTNTKPVGLYLLNADQTYVKGPVGNGFYSGSGGVGPYRVRANDDGTVLVCDFSTANASLVQYSPDLSSSNLVLGIIGQTAAAAAGIHGDLFGCGILKGSLAAGNLVLYTFDSGMPTPSDTNCIKGPITGPGSFNCVFRYNIGSGPLPWNKRPDYAYTYGLDGIADLRTEGDIGKDGKIFCAFGRANASNPNLQILRPPLTTNGITGDAVNADIQNAARSATNWVYTGGVNPPFNLPPNGAAADPWVGGNGSGVNNGTYAGVRVSPDGAYVAAVDINNGVTLASLTNGVPNDGTIFGIAQGTSGATTGLNQAQARGMDWDAANNIWIASSGQGLLRCFSLGLTTTCISSNDWTGTNGTFQLAVPALQSSVAVVNGTASQNYVNNTINAGAPIPGVFRISLNTNNTTGLGPVSVGFVRGGTAAYTNNYTINTNELPNGVTVTPNAVIFPAGVFSGSNGPNWNVDVKITPTKLPLSGPTLSFNVRLIGGTNYAAAAPLNGSIAILNTGPQLLQLSAAAPTTLGGMNRGIPNDQARFIITRLGDTNGPNNDAVNPIVSRPLTITAVNYFPPATGSNFMAKPGVDFTAQAQKFTPGGAPVDGAPGIVINPGEVTVTGMIGNPVKHIDTNLRTTNLTVAVNLTNICDTTTTPGCNTNQLSGEGYPYLVTTTTLTLNEFDNAVGGEVVLWSNPLTNSFDSTNWTLVFANANMGASPVLPSVVSNYDNSANGPGNYTVAFGKPINDPANDGGVAVPASAAMAANGWSSALKLSVNKNPQSAGESGVNLYPQIPGAPWTGSNFMNFQGNYALRFDMFLSLYDFGINNGAIGTPAREFAAFGINHHGTNANWRLDVNPRADGTGARPINADGEWCSIGAASGSITPADYDMFIAPPWAEFDANGTPIAQTVPFTTNLLTFAPFTNAYQSSPGVYIGVTNLYGNAGTPNDQQSANNNAFGGAPQNGIVKYPPFLGINQLGGAPDNAWIDVSLELSRQTNLTLLVARQPIFSSSILNPIFGTVNPLAPFGGTPMLGYLDPNIDISDYSAFVYYSNVRLVEMSPFIPWTNQPASLMVTQGSSFTLSSAALFASNPLTNVWYFSTTNGSNVLGRRDNGTPTAPIVTNTFNATNGSSDLSVVNLQSPTNYITVWSDQAGSITSFVASIEMVTGPGDKTVLATTPATFTVVPSGNAPPTSFRWMFYGTNLVNSAKYVGATTASLTINNVTADDAGVYSNVIANAFSSLTVAGTLTVNSEGTPPYQFSSIANAGANVNLAFTTANPADTAASFQLQSAGLVTGPYTNNPAVISGTNPDFLVSVPKTGTQLFYRLQHK